jgi:two-component system alkaline phosphatase synthesis response regulator PhoP
LRNGSGTTQLIVPVHEGPNKESPPLDLVDVISRVGDVLGGRDRATEQVRTYRFGDVEVDFSSYTATRAGHRLDLSSREFEIIRLLVERRGHVVTREELLRCVWGTIGSSLTRTVDVHIAKLRKKIGDPPQNPRYIVTIHRSGYKFIA